MTATSGCPRPYFRRLGAVESLKEQVENLLDILGEDVGVEVLGERVEDLEGEVVVGAAGDEALEDAQDGHDLGGDEVARDVGEEEAREGGNVAGALPQQRHEQEGEEVAVDGRQRVAGGGRLQLEQEREELEGVGDELGDVLLEDEVEDGEEVALQLIHRGCKSN